ncbi:Uncharacterized mitochondrial protein AtMg00860, partial [Striga hermonthica]
LKGKGIIPDPRPVRTPEDKLDKTRYCAYHKSPGHNTDECLGLLSALLRLIGQPQLQKFRNFDNRRKGRPLDLSDDEDEDNRPANQKRARANDKEVFTFSTHVGTSTDNHRKPKIYDPPDFSHSIPRVNSNNKQLDTSRRKVKAYTREAQNAEKRVMNVDLRDTINKRNCPITFSIEDANLFAHPYSDALIITAPIGGIPVHRILVDTGAYSSILMLCTFKNLGLDPADIRPCNDQIQGFNGSISCPVGEILLPIRFGGFGPKSKIIMETFKVLDVQNEYNVVIGRTALYKLRAAVSIFHYALKFPTIEGEGTHYGDQREARSLMLLSTSRSFHMMRKQDADNSVEPNNSTSDAERTDQFIPDTDMPQADVNLPLVDTDVPMTSVLPETSTKIPDQEQLFHERDIQMHEDMDPRMQFKDGSHHVRAEPVEDIEIIYVDGSTQQKSLRIGANLQEPIRSNLIQFLQSNTDVFAWKHEDMKGIDLRKACHRLNLDKTVKPVIQKRRKFGPDRHKALEEEVNGLIDNKFVKEAKYPTWISNPVLVKKATGLWRLCIDFSDLNQACPKDSYPIPHIDYMVDATSGHQLMSFLDAYSGYNQIPMHPDDAEHTSFYSARGLYCYVMMTFGLKNAGATYQRLVNKMFALLIGHTMEVYVDDMLVKSEQASDHIAHLSEVFDILREYSMVLNPKKCTFGVGSGKFLGYMVSQRGIEANPAKIQAILNLSPPTSLKGVQALTDRLAALNRFISKSTDHCKPFFDAIKKKKPFEWTTECQNAFDNIKKVLLRLPTLQKPLPDEPLYLYLGVSGVAVSAVLIRQDGLQQFPVYYVSKALHDAELRYPHMEKLAYALIIAARKLRPYFLEHSIVVFTTYPLRQVLHRPDTSGRMIKWAIELGQFDIQYRPRTAIKAQ